MRLGRGPHNSVNGQPDISEYQDEFCSPQTKQFRRHEALAGFERKNQRLQPWYDRRQVRYDNFGGPSQQASTRHSAGGLDRVESFLTCNPAIDKANLRSKNTFYPWEESCAASFEGQATQPHEEVVSLPAIQASVSVQDSQMLLFASE